MSWIRGTPDLSDSLIIEPQIVLCYCCVLVFLEVLLLFLKIDQLLVQWLIEQLEILQTSLNVAAFPEPILSTADVVLRILDFVVA